jgi:type IV pilus assembly protein PilO
MNLTMPNLSKIRITARHWHYAAVVFLCVVNLVLAARLAYAWKRASAGDPANLQQHEATYRAMQLKTKPLRGLDKKIDQAQLDEQAFYGKRFPATYSEVLADLGALAVKNNVLLSREQFAQGKLDQGVYMLRMDANLTGDYAPIVRFINGLERDKLFFMIEGVALSGQQGGTVSLRMRLATFLRADAENSAASTAAGETTSGSATVSHPTQAAPSTPAAAQPVNHTRERH